MEELILIADGQPWPRDGADAIATLVFLAIAFGAPALGYFFMVVDIRAYLRALKGALIVVRNHLPHIPTWANQYTPNCVRSLGLQMPCREEDVKRAYRKLAETLHPDRGGDRHRFMTLQEQFEDAMTYVREANQRS